MKKENIKKFIKILFITLLIGGVLSFFLMDKMKEYSSLPKPFLSPPSYVFAIVWPVLFVLMSISMYMVDKDSKKENDKKQSYIIYFTQLIVNSLWTLVFFGLQLRLVAFIQILVLIVMVLYMIMNFYETNKTAGLIQIPYVLWLIFAAYLNYGVYLLNG